jgi:PIN domain nuclease of toxin-antitoxin system
VRLLLDTHTLLWWLDGDRRLPARVRRLVGDDRNEVLVSAASAWEICTKVRIGKLPGAVEVAADVPGCVASQGFVGLDITIAHAQRAGSLPSPHRDPFDRMLAAQAQAEGLPLVSNDPAFELLQVERLW